jgi:RNA polymerase sigma-70 factor (ECF subfamily)
VRLNGAVAVAFAEGIDVGLRLVDELSGDLDGYHPFHAARADLLRRLGRSGGSAAAYERAIALCGNDAERAFLRRRLDEVSSTPTRPGGRPGRT